MRLLLILMLFLTMVPSITIGQDKLFIIKESSFYTDNRSIYFVVSNKFNSSGKLGPVKNMASEIILVGKEEATNMFDNKGFALGLDDFQKKFSSNRAYTNPMTIAIKIPGISLNGFEVIDRHYGSYKSKIFYRYEELKGIDFNSFEIINNKWKEDFTKDKNAVFYKAERILNADPQTFEVLEFGFSKDKRHVYRIGELLKDADPKSFQIIDYIYQKDENQVWAGGRSINADVKTFELLKYHLPGYETAQTSLYAIDKNHVYFQGNVMPEADLQTFKIVCSDAPYQYYAIDKNHVYYCDKVVAGADAETFNVVLKKTSNKQYDAYDKDHLYYRDRKEAFIPKD